MVSKKLFLPVFSIKKVLFFLFILSIIPFIQTLSFKYPTALTLNDGKIFVIHSLGIDICNAEYTTSSRQLTFSTELDETTLSKISISKYSNGEFIIFIIDRFYLFDAYGNQKIEVSTPNQLYGEYYFLTRHKKVGNSYYFLFGYIRPYYYTCHIYYCCINANTGSLSVLDSKSFANDIKFVGLSCEFSFYSSKEYFICVYESSKNSKYYTTIHNYYISSNSIIYSDKLN